MAGSMHYAVELTEKVTNPEGTVSPTKPFGTEVASEGESWVLNNVAEGTSFSDSAYDQYMRRTYASNNTTQ